MTLEGARPEWEVLPGDERRVEQILARLGELAREDQTLRDELFMLTVKVSARPKSKPL